VSELPDGVDARDLLVASERDDLLHELLAAARPLAAALGGRVAALMAGAMPDDSAAEAIARGADEALVAEPARERSPASERLFDALLAATASRRFALVLVGATRAGTDAAARLAQRLRLPLASRCCELGLDPRGELRFERRVLGGRFLAAQRLAAAPAIATVEPRRFEAAPRDDARSGAITRLALAPVPSRMRVRSVVPRELSAVDITRAEVLVAAGRGLRTREDLALVEALAGALGGAVAASRPITDDRKWLPPDRKVGLSGLTVKPKLYVACGISGQIEHVVGARGARSIVAINSDARAPIHAHADWSVVADLYEFLPALTRRLTKLARRPAALPGAAAK
jgi:electron transfer flavoprotein alpha subunit